MRYKYYHQRYWSKIITVCIFIFLLLLVRSISSQDTGSSTSDIKDSCVFRLSLLTTIIASTSVVFISLRSSLAVSVKVVLVIVALSLHLASSVGPRVVGISA